MKSVYEVFAPLASLKVQQRYIVDGTKDEYLMPEELLSSAITALRSHKLTPELSEVQAALAACDPPPGISASQLVHEHVPWIRLRETIQAYLRATGFDLERWEANEL